MGGKEREGRLLCEFVCLLLCLSDEGEGKEEESIY